MRSLDRKLGLLREGSDAFILADAKDGDMAFGVCGTGPRFYVAGGGGGVGVGSGEGLIDGGVGCRSLDEFLDVIREVVGRGLVDIMLMSASVNERLTIGEGLFVGSDVTPAARANDATDIWGVRFGRYGGLGSRPFRSASIDSIRCGRSVCGEGGSGGFAGADLGLYSVTFVNDVEADRRSLEAFRLFREEAELKGFRYFLEVFDPVAGSGVPAEGVGAFVNDHIVRSLAGVTAGGRPIFLKVVYHGARAMEELVGYDPGLVVGVLGGSAGTTYDAFRLLYEAQRYGARAALFGRKINYAEHQPAFIEMLRLIADGRIGPLEAVHAYHGVLQGKGIRPRRSLAEDVRLTDGALRSDVGSGGVGRGGLVSVRGMSKGKGGKVGWPVKGDGKPDFGGMSSEERRVYDRARLGL